jgi:hypothetical protein
LGSGHVSDHAVDCRSPDANAAIHPASSLSRVTHFRFDRVRI